MAISQTQSGQPKLRRVVLAIAGTIVTAVLVAVIGSDLPMTNRTTVGDLNLAPIAGAESHFYVGQHGSGNIKVYHIRLKTTEVLISFYHLYADKEVSLNDVKTDIENWRKIDASNPKKATVKHLGVFPINSGGIKGFYQPSEVVQRTGHVYENRELSVVKSGKDYYVTFGFLHTNDEEDKQKVDEAWVQTLNDIGLSALPATTT